MWIWKRETVLNYKEYNISECWNTILVNDERAVRKSLGHAFGGGFGISSAEGA